MIPIRLSDIREEHLQRLVENQVPESTTMEFKSDLDPEGGLSSYVQHVCAFANTEGGDLIYGICEENHVAVEVCGMPQEGREVVMQKFENVARDGLDPRLMPSSLRIWPVNVGEDRVVYVVRVERSRHLPHRVSRGSEHRYFGRNSAGKFVLNAADVRELAISQGAQKETLERWRRARVSEAESELNEVVLARKEVDETHTVRLYVHVVPLAGVHTRDLVSPDTESELRSLGPPSAWSAISTTPSMEGLYVVEGYRTLTRSYTHWFEDGRVELAAVVRVLDAKHRHSSSISANHLECLIQRGVSLALKGLAVLDIPPSYLLYATLTGCTGQTLIFDSVGVLADEGNRAVRRNAIFYPPLAIEDVVGEDEDLWIALKPLLDRIARSFGYRRSPFFDRSGKRLPNRSKCH